jgi:hypothetical protein
MQYKNNNAMAQAPQSITRPDRAFHLFMQKKGRRREAKAAAQLQ